MEADEHTSTSPRHSLERTSKRTADGSVTVRVTKDVSQESIDRICDRTITLGLHMGKPHMGRKTKRRRRRGVVIFDPGPMPILTPRNSANGLGLPLSLHGLRCSPRLSDLGSKVRGYSKAALFPHDNITWPEQSK